jgi:hypothetical protein
MFKFVRSSLGVLVISFERILGAKHPPSMWGETVFHSDHECLKRRCWLSSHLWIVEFNRPASTMLLYDSTSCSPRCACLPTFVHFLFQLRNFVRLRSSGFFVHVVPYHYVQHTWKVGISGVVQAPAMTQTGFVKNTIFNQRNDLPPSMWGETVFHSDNECLKGRCWLSSHLWIVEFNRPASTMLLYDFTSCSPRCACSPTFVHFLFQLRNFIRLRNACN